MWIAIEGIIGIGKSTLQKTMLTFYNGTLISQEFKSHPTLTKFYEYPDRYGLATTMIFLYMGFSQLNEALANEGLIISDFTLEKFDVFARATLDSTEYDEIFLPAYCSLVRRLPRPDAVIWLRGGANVALARIRRRGRKMEQGLSRSVLDELEVLYGDVLDGLRQSTLVLDVDGHHSLARSRQGSFLLFEQIERLLPVVGEFRLPE